MNSLERVMAAINFQETDRTPIIAPVFGHAAHLANISMDRYLQDGELLAKCQIQALEHYNYDAVFALMDVNVETEAMGSVLQYEHNTYAGIKNYAISSPSDIFNLSLPDFTRAGRIPELLQAASILRQEVGHNTLVVGVALGPLNLACQLMGMEKTLYLAVDEPEIFTQLLDFCTEFCISFGVAQINAGVHLPILFDVSASSEVIPPQFFREFELPRLKKIFRAFKAAGASANWLFITGNIDPILPYYAEADVDIANFDYCVTPETIKKSLPGICVNGNIKPILFEYGDPGEISAISADLLEQFSKRRGFILCAGCEIPLQAKPENIKAMVESVKKKQRGTNLPKITLMADAGGDEENFVISFSPGKSLRTILNATDHQVRTGCLGNGACGLCLVRIVEGVIDQPGENEKLLLSEKQLAGGVRLACQVTPQEDLKIEIINKVPASSWKNIPEDKYHFSPGNPYLLSDITTEPYYLNDQVKHPYGAAVDLGTTAISVTLFNLTDGQLLTTRYGLNPQLKHGSDVLTRIMTAAESPQKAQSMSREVVEAIKEIFWDMAVADGINLKQVTRMVLAGNTAMLTLLTGHKFELLLNPRYWDQPIDLQLPDTSSWASAWQIFPQAEIEIIPPIAGFIGSDLTAGILATSLNEGEPGSILIDFGTNSEMALWDGETLWTTSAAGGPAFEGCGISCGMPGESGAIYRFDLKEHGNMEFSVIDHCEPRGICGSGLVDLVSDLITSNQLTNVGKFSPDISGNRFELSKKDISLTLKDIDLIQRAKSAIATGLNILLNKAGMKFTGIKQLYIGGAFGYHLNINKAQNIGLLPPIDSGRIKLCGNSAINGCEQVLLAADAEEKLNRIKRQLKIINLANCEDFDEVFFQNLFLSPMEL